MGPNSAELAHLRLPRGTADAQRIGGIEQHRYVGAYVEVYGVLAVTFPLPGTDMVVAAKLVMVVIWIGAATAKFNKHAPFLIATMMSSSPLVR